MTSAKTRKPVNRSAKLLSLGGQLPALALTTGKVTTFYALEALPVQFGKAAFRLSKANGGEVYDVMLDGPRSSCECMGFLRHHRCKHVEGLTALARSGRIAVPQVQAPAPQFNDFDDP